MAKDGFAVRAWTAAVEREVTELVRRAVG